MIKCKEELINTYVKNIPELRGEFLSLAVKFGLIDSKSEIGDSSEGAVVAYWHDVTRDNPKVGCWFFYAGQIKEECRELTLSDFKPTRTEYVQVNDNEMLAGDILYLGDSGTCECIFIGLHPKTSGCVIETPDNEIISTPRSTLYRRVENVVDWHSELDLYLNQPSCDGFESELPTRVRITLNDIEFHLTDSEYLESCRVALRANGEID